MATTDEYVKYDIRFFEEFAPYLMSDYTKTELKGVRRAVEQGLIQRERLVELAISAVSGVHMDSTAGRDLADGTDVKTVTSSYKNNNLKKGTWTHSYPIRRVSSKTGALRVVAYNRLLDEFYYFLIPFGAYRHINHTLEIVAETFSGPSFIKNRPPFTGIPRKHLQWWQYECKSFEEMCLTTPNKVRVRKKLIIKS